MKETLALISAYNLGVQQYFAELQAPLTEASIKEMVARIQSSAIELIAIGDNVEEVLKKDELSEQERAIAYALHFEWIEESKQTLVLWRDTLFQYQKGLILLHDKKVETEALEDLHQAAKEVVGEALSSQEEAFNRIQGRIATEKEAVHNTEKWKLLSNPWPIYKEQIDDLGRQAAILATQYGELERVTQEFDHIREETEGVVRLIQIEMTHLLEIAESANIFINEHTQDPKRIVFQLESMEQQLKEPIKLEQYKEQIRNYLLEHNKVIHVPIDTLGGMVRYKELNFGKGIRQWLESEIQPSLYEMVDITERASNAMKMSLINIRNRAILLTKDHPDGKAQDAQSTTISNQTINQPLILLQENLESWKAELEEAQNTVIDRLSDSFRITHIYNSQEEFLPVPIQSTLNQLRIDQNVYWTRIKNWIKERTTAIQKIRSTVLKEESLSDAEKIIRYVKSRVYNHDHHHYDSIFTAEGYIGDSFCVGRKQELEHIVSLINDWREGYRGAAVVHGKRFSGKTMFGDLVCHRYFHHQAIVLRPSNVINIYGRRLIINYDLGEALDFIDKYAQNRKKIIWIDDLELWNDKTISISQNIQHLMNHIDRGNNKLFYLVSMNSWSWHHYNRLFGLGESIQSEIHLNGMSSDEIKKAILIRHGATHKTLIDLDGKEMNSQEFNRLSTDYYRASEGNIGEALRLWAYASEVTTDETVKMNALPPYDIPDFIDDDMAIVLRAILLQKYTNEYNLNKQFGPAFKEKYKVLILRLRSLGILRRREDGRLEISEGVVNGVAHLLQKDRLIKTDSRK